MQWIHDWSNKNVYQYNAWHNEILESFYSYFVTWTLKNCKEQEYLNM